MTMLAIVAAAKDTLVPIYKGHPRLRSGKTMLAYFSSLCISVTVGEKYILSEI